MIRPQPQRMQGCESRLFIHTSVPSFETVKVRCSDSDQGFRDYYVDLCDFLRLSFISRILILIRMTVKPASLLCSLVTKGRQQRFPWGGHWTWLLWLGWCVITSFCIFYHHCGHHHHLLSLPTVSCHLHHKSDHRDHCNLMCKSVYLSFPLESSLSLCCWPGLLP